MAAKARVSVVGAGLMGHGIAQVFAVRGHVVRVFDSAGAMLDTLNDRIRANLADLDQDVSAADHVIATPVLADAVRDADVVIEAGPENLAIKQRLFLDVEAAAPRGAILASNTSVIPITQIMAPLTHKSRGLGTHWWNPPFLVPLVEVIRTEWTDSAVLARTSELLRDVGKTPVTVNKDVAGFVGNRLQHALWREAIALVQNGVCDAETVDTVVKAGFGRRLAVLGPLENADLVGTELTLAIHETVLPDIDTTPGPLPYLRQLVESGRLGMKSGEGFRRWTQDEQQALRRRVASYLRDLLKQGI
ncbi:MAG TPA: 3-hydroxyacyl-CoA dehydrogenase family protein [Steroidobacteraceae bacterium]|jgi:3-hydroxybutyryl-CoA dehydrogenase|nr:3-hydroxyacyl-CoA dehydrogenase family protein [Steroidobacteraceae bacterium]